MQTWCNAGFAHARPGHQPSEHPAMQMLEQVQLLGSQGWEYCLQASYLEVYNETLRDLLAPRQASQTIGDLNAIRHDPSGMACSTAVASARSCSGRRRAGVAWVQQPAQAFGWRRLCAMRRSGHWKWVAGVPWAAAAGSAHACTLLSPVLACRP